MKSISYTTSLELCTLYCILKNNPTNTFIINRIKKLENNLLLEILLSHLNKLMEITISKDDTANPNNLSTDIKNYQTRNSITDHFLLQVYIQYLTKIFSRTSHQLSNCLFNSIRCQKIISTNFNIQTSRLFLSIIDDYIRKNNADDLESLKALRDYIFIKYLNTSEIKATLPTEQYNIANIINNLIDTSIRECILSLLEYSDEAFASPELKEHATIEAIYLRSLLVMLNDESALIEYDNFYNQCSPTETKAKKLIREAFIQNYYDLEYFPVIREEKR